MNNRLVVLVLAHGLFGWGEDATDSLQDQMKDYYYGVKKFLDAEYGTWTDLNLVLVMPTV